MASFQLKPRSKARRLAYFLRAVREQGRLLHMTDDDLEEAAKLLEVADDALRADMVGVDQMGTAKVVTTARQAFEIEP